MQSRRRRLGILSWVQCKMLYTIKSLVQAVKSMWKIYGVRRNACDSEMVPLLILSEASSLECASTSVPWRQRPHLSAAPRTATARRVDVETMSSRRPHDPSTLKVLQQMPPPLPLREDASCQLHFSSWIGLNDWDSSPLGLYSQILYRFANFYSWNVQPTS